MSAEVESTEVSDVSSAVPEVSAKESAAPAEAVSADTGEGAAKSAALDPSDSPIQAPVYTPNYKFKANQKEMEFDKWLQPTIKSAEHEKKLRELYEKAHGLDTVKPERDQLKQEYGQLSQEHQSLQRGLDKLSHFVQKKDYESVFQALGFPKQDIMQYALLQLKLQEATPEQRAAYENQRTEAQRLYELEQHNSYLQEQFQQQAVSQRQAELNYAFQRPEVSAVMQAFDQRMGKVGAFRDEVIRRGQLYFATQQQDIPVDQAISEVMSLIGQQQQAAQQAANVAPNPRAQQPVIPNIHGRSSASPARKVYKSLDAIKQRAKEVANQE